MTKTMFGCRPDPVCYMPLPGTCEADVWLRKNITSPETGEEDSCWTADEVYFRTTMPMEDVQANFDTLFERDGLMTVPESDIGMRISDLEEALNMILEGTTE